MQKKAIYLDDCCQVQTEIKTQWWFSVGRFDYNGA